MTLLGRPDPLSSQAYGLTIQGNSTQTLLAEAVQSVSLMMACPKHGPQRRNS